MLTSLPNQTNSAKPLFLSLVNANAGYVKCMESLAKRNQFKKKEKNQGNRMPIPVAPILLVHAISMQKC